jgi:hypothetical protein
MKRLPDLVIICCVALGLLTSGKTGMKSGDSVYKGLVLQQEHDTTGFTGFLKVDSFNLQIIPPSSGVRFFRNSIVFLSNTKYEGKMLPKHVSFGSIEAYTAQVNDSSLGNHVIFSPTSSFSYPCEAITFSSDFKTMYFTKIGRKEKREMIYRAELKSDINDEIVWAEDPEPIDFCTGNYTYTHPALSADGKFMIFASDRDGVTGSMDLFITRKNGLKWSAPEILGKQINTKGNEFFPFLDSDNNLFFSSDGLPGYGGYDIFTCKYNGETWDKPVNLSRKINSTTDDIAFNIDRIDGRSAFFTTRQKSGRFEMELHRVTIRQEPSANNPLTIAYIYNGKPVTQTALTAIKQVEPDKPLKKEPAKLTPDQVKKEEVKVPEKKAPAVTETKPKAPEAKVVTFQATTSLPEELKDVVVYRIQFFSSTKKWTENQIVLGGKSYKIYEYFYLNAYRYTVGEFTTLAPAKELQSICRKTYPQAFVAAFKNETRSLDLTLFK